MDMGVARSPIGAEVPKPYQKFPLLVERFGQLLSQNWHSQKIQTEPWKNWGFEIIKSKNAQTWFLHDHIIYDHKGGLYISSPLLRYLLSKKLSWIFRDPPSRADFQLRVYKVPRTLLEYLPTVFTNSRRPLGDSRRSFGDILGDILRNNLRDNLRDVSGNLLTSEDSWKLSRDTPKVSFDVYKPSVESWPG